MTQSPLATLRTDTLRTILAHARASRDAVVIRVVDRELARRDPIVTWHAFPPIPCRDFDWGAHRDSDEGGEGRMGWGRTEAEAIADLLALEADDQD